MERCKGINKNSSPCKKFPLKGNEYCHFHLKESLNDVCPICLEKEPKMYPLSCSHQLHLECCQGLMKLECPICRSQVINLPKNIVEKIKENIQKYKEEITNQETEEIRRQEDFIRSLLNGNAIDITPQLEAHQALEYLYEKGIPSNFIQNNVEISPAEDSPLPRGYIFHTIVSDALERLRQVVGEEEINMTMEEYDELEEDIYKVFPEEVNNERIYRRVRLRVNNRQGSSV